MNRIERVEILQVDLAPAVQRTDAIQSFVSQETPIVRIACADGAIGTGYAYTIGTGGSSVVALLRVPMNFSFAKPSIRLSAPSTRLNIGRIGSVPPSRMNTGSR